LDLGAARRGAESLEQPLDRRQSRRRIDVADND
jgi:hypothetical protein